MAIFVDVTLNRVSGIPEDACHNGFWFVNNAPSATSEEMDDITGWLTDFYNQVNSPSTIALAGFISAPISRVTDAHRFTFYDREMVVGQGLGAPVRETPWTLGAVSGNPFTFPSECAVVLSTHASAPDVPENAPGGARPKARHRGRVFVGPLNSNTAATVGATQEVVVSQPFRDVLAAAALGLIADSTAGGNPWSVFSRRDLVLRPIVGGFVDDAYDTIRSRGQDATVRTNFGAAA